MSAHPNTSAADRTAAAAKPKRADRAVARKREVPIPSETRPGTAPVDAVFWGWASPRPRRSEPIPETNCGAAFWSWAGTPDN